MGLSNRSKIVNLLFLSDIWAVRSGTVQLVQTPKKRLQYKLRPRNHNLALTCRTSYYDIVIVLPE